MNRRGFFGTIAGLFATAFLPARPQAVMAQVMLAQVMLDGENMWFLIPKTPHAWDKYCVRGTTLKAAPRFTEEL